MMIDRQGDGGESVDGGDGESETRRWRQSADYATWCLKVVTWLKVANPEAAAIPYLGVA